MSVALWPYHRLIDLTSEGWSKECVSAQRLLLTLLGQMQKELGPFRLWSPGEHNPKQRSPSQGCPMGWMLGEVPEGPRKVCCPQLAQQLVLKFSGGRNGENTTLSDVLKRQWGTVHLTGKGMLGGGVRKVQRQKAGVQMSGVTYDQRLGNRCSSSLHRICTLKSNSWNPELSEINAGMLSPSEYKSRQTSMCRKQQAHLQVWGKQK